MTGHNKIKMTELSSLFEKLGFDKAETFIQSGNVIFNDPINLTGQDITIKIEVGIRRKFGYDIPAAIRSITDIKKIVSVNPFLFEEGFDPAKMAVMFMREKPDESKILKVRDINYPPDKFKIEGKEIFIYCPDGFGKSKLYTNFFENKMKVIGTARNWKTINTLLEIAERKESGN
jgi:uncharacterized protein (DUF1697 family)